MDRVSASYCKNKAVMSPKDNKRKCHKIKRELAWSANDIETVDNDKGNNQFIRTSKNREQSDTVSRKVSKLAKGKSLKIKSCVKTPVNVDEKVLDSTDLVKPSTFSKKFVYKAGHKILQDKHNIKEKNVVKNSNDVRNIKKKKKLSIFETTSDEPKSAKKKMLMTGEKQTDSSIGNNEKVAKKTKRKMVDGNDEMPNKRIKISTYNNSSLEFMTPTGQSEDNSGDIGKEKRTVFVGNLPRTDNEKGLLALFEPCGPVENIRYRGAIGKDASARAKRVAMITKSFHCDTNSLFAYILFKNEIGVQKALLLNGREFDGSRLRVDTIDKRNDQQNNRNTVFLGNLPFTVTDNDLYKHFADCGNIEYVRVVRDAATGIGKGFGYIKFSDGLESRQALKMDGSSCHGRSIRVKPCDTKHKEKKDLKRAKKMKTMTKDAQTVPRKKSGLARPTNFIKSSFPTKIKKKTKKKASQNKKAKKLPK